VLYLPDNQRDPEITNAIRLGNAPARNGLDDTENKEWISAQLDRLEKAELEETARKAASARHVRHPIVTPAPAPVQFIAPPPEIITPAPMR
jgi:hypothetical protein